MSRGKEKEGLPKVHMVVCGGEGSDTDGKCLEGHSSHGKASRELPCMAPRHNMYKLVSNNHNLVQNESLPGPAQTTLLGFLIIDNCCTQVQGLYHLFSLHITFNN